MPVAGRAIYERTPVIPNVGVMVVDASVACPERYWSVSAGRFRILMFDTYRLFLAATINVDRRGWCAVVCMPENVVVQVIERTEERNVLRLRVWNDNHVQLPRRSYSSARAVVEGIHRVCTTNSNDIHKSELDRPLYASKAERYRYRYTCYTAR